MLACNGPRAARDVCLVIPSCCVSKPILTFFKFHTAAVFFHQHSCTTVYLLLFNETSIKLFQFNRSGMQYCLPFEFHDHPVSFVCLILKVASEDDLLVGFDNSIYWQGGVRYIQTPVAKQQMEIWRIVDDIPIYLPERLTGKVTTCWKVQHESSGGNAPRQGLVEPCFKSLFRDPFPPTGQRPTWTLTDGCA